MSFQITDPKIQTDQGAVNIAPNTVKFNDGLGTRKVHVQSAGAGALSGVISDDISTHIAKLSFEMYNTVENIATARAWKASDGALSFTMIGNSPDGSTKRSFLQATVVNDPEYSLTSDGRLMVEVESVKVSR